jgi:hypothetical protein
MLILNDHNKILDTDKISEACAYSVLRFKDTKNPDFFFEELGHVEEFTSHTIKLGIGDYTTFVPFHWSILCSDLEYIQTIPLHEFSGRPFQAFCMNPIDGFMPHYPVVRILEIFQNITWSCPPMKDKDMLVIPIGDNPQGNGKGPLCAIMSPHKLDISRPIGDIL